MNLKKLIKKISVHACVYFTVIVAFYSLIAWLINANDGVVLINAGNVFLYFIFSVLLAVANGIFSLKSIHSGARLVIHLLICLVAFYTCFLLPLSLNASGLLVGIVTFILIYFIIAGLIALFSARYKKNTEKTEEYVNQYKKKF